MRVRRLVVFALVAFALFFIITQPVAAAEMVRAVAEATVRFAVEVAQAFSTFLSTLF